MSRLCPECQIHLDQIQFHGVVLDECSGCGGVWFDDGELKRCQAGSTSSLVELEDTIAPAVLWHQQDHTRLCPDCNIRLTTYKYQYTSDILLDECTGCYGIWVQDGELKKIAEFAKEEDAPIDDDVLGAAKTRMEAAGLVEVLEHQTQANKARTRRIQTLWGSISRRYAPFTIGIR